MAWGKVDLCGLDTSKLPVLTPQRMQELYPLVHSGDKAARDEISRLNAAVMGRDTDPYYGAPVLVLALADPASSTWVEDASCALENMMLAAHALGLGSVWVHREREIFDSEAGKALLRAWGLPETLRGVGSIALGYASGPAPAPAPRKDDYIVRV